jgi:transcriptional repressor NrdR
VSVRPVRQPIWRADVEPNARYGVAVICPQCAHADSRVVESRVAATGDAIRRRRACVECGMRFTTFERVEEAPLWVLKRDGSRQPFSRAKLLRGLERACAKRPIPLDQVEATAAAVEAELRAGPVREVPSESIGEAALRRLRDLDGVAYVRFASVYRCFDDVEEFQQELELLDLASVPPEGAFEAVRTYVR